MQYYHDWNDVFPSAAEKSLADGGRILRIIFNGRDFSSQANDVNWWQIANGSQDANIARIADNVKAFGQRLFLTFHGEPEGSDGASAVGRTGTTGGFGTLAEFVTAWRHVHDIFAARGVTNAVWVLSYANPDAATAAAAYVGDSYCDWLGWDPYNWYDCNGHTDPWLEFVQKTAAFYGWAQANHPGKPLMIGEYSSDEPNAGDGRSKGDWFRHIAADLAAQRPAIRAVICFDRPFGGGCLWRVDSSADALAGWKAMGADPYFNQPHG